MLSLPASSIKPSKLAAMANSNFSNPADVNLIDLSDSTPVPSSGGSSSSSSAEQVATPTSPSERTRSESLCKCPRPRPEQSESETTLPSEQGRPNNCACCKKREFDTDWTCDIVEGCMAEILEAIGEFRDLYQTIEYMKTWCRPKKPKNGVLERVAKMNEENEERLHKFMAEQQAAMAKINEEKEERLQKLMAEQQVVLAKIVADAVKDAVKDAVGGRLDSPAE